MGTSDVGLVLAQLASVGSAIRPDEVRAAVAAAARSMARARRLDPAAVGLLLPCDVSSLRPLLPALPRTEDLGLLYEQLAARAAGRSDRKERGMFFTPPALVEPTVARCLAPLLGVEPLALRVCDPAVGGGAFLVAAARAIADAAGGGAAARAAAATHCVFGVDLDADAAAVARLALWLEAADPDLDPALLHRRVKRGNAVLGAWRGSGAAAAEPAAARDRWCAEWFAPALAAPRTAELAARLGFFHWELEFADVMARGGFDAVVGNPPWDVHRPDARRFLTAIDPAFAAHTRPELARAQRELLAARPDVAAAWQSQLDDHRAFRRFVSRAHSPFRLQGSGDPNRYKLFVELTWHLLRAGGRFGLLVPSGLYSDLGSAPLRRLLFDEGRWEWLYAFENRRGVFPIDTRCKFAAVVVEKGGATRELRAAFLRTDPIDWQTAAAAVELPAEWLRRQSPKSRSIPECVGARDLELQRRLTSVSEPFGAQLGRRVRFCRELDLTLDAHRFPPRTDWEARGYRPDVYSRWVLVRAVRTERPPVGEHWVALRDGGHAAPDEVLDVALPVWEGRMIGAFDFSEKGWVQGRGRSAQWRSIPFEDKRVEPQYLIDARALAEVDPHPDRPKIGFMAVTSATNARSMIATSLLHAPCGNAVPTLRGADVVDDLVLLGVLGSFAYDAALRFRLVGTNLNRFVLEETPVPRPERRAAIRALAPHVAALAWPHLRFAGAWLALPGADRTRPWQEAWAVTRAERLRRRCIVDAVVAAAYGLDAEDLAWLLRGCASARPRAPSDRKGFWRVDRTDPPELRLTVLVRVAFAALEQELAANGGDLERAAHAFCGGNGDPGWQLPTQIAERLGPPLAACPSGLDAASSWADCARHAALADPFAPVRQRPAAAVRKPAAAASPSAPPC